MNIVDLPAGILTSPYLTEQDHTQLATCERFPTEKELFEMRPVPEVIYILETFGHDFLLFEEEMHLLAQLQIAQGNEWFAFKLLMVVEYTRQSLV